MIKSLFVKNYALLDDVHVTFENGLNILTGETGAGKSILIGALNTVLGERAEHGALRDGAEKAIIEVIFSTEGSPEVQSYLKASELDQGEDELILRREILKSGRTRSFVNDTPVQVATLEQIGELLVDLHGQHDHQSLLKTSKHIQFLDHFGGLTELAASVETDYHQLLSKQKELSEWQGKAAQSNEKKDIFEFQISEIDAVNPAEGEEEALIKEENLLQNSERLFQITSNVYRDLYEKDDSMYEVLSRTVEQLNELKQIDDRLARLPEECESAKIMVDEVAKVLQHYNSSIEFNPDRLQEIRERLSLFSGLKKKYGGTIEDVIQQRDELKQKLEHYANFDSTIKSLRGDIETRKQSLSKTCDQLSAARTAKASLLENLIVKNLADLGMQRAVFEVKIEQIPDESGFVKLNGKSLKTSAKGIDDVEFQIAVNPGSGVKSLAKVASGGEISRIMLALKSAQAESDRLPVMIFDEIDSGVSGRIAQAVGRAMRHLSKTHQIICITHLPQIASMGDNQYSVEKIVHGNQTRTLIKKLVAEERAVAIAKLLGGENITETHIKSAEQLILEGSTDA